MLEFRRTLCRNSNVKPSHILVSALCFALAACGQHDASPAPAQTAASNGAVPVAEDTAHAGKLPRVASPARIAEIKASGKTGFWSDPTEFCPNRRVAVLTWNVQASGASKVILYVVGKDGKERNFGRGGPIGERQTGPWLKPDLTFKLRNADGGAELGSITYARGNSC